MNRQKSKNESGNPPAHAIKDGDQHTGPSVEHDIMNNESPRESAEELSSKSPYPIQDLKGSAKEDIDFSSNEEHIGGDTDVEDVQNRKKTPDNQDSVEPHKEFSIDEEASEELSTSLKHTPVEDDKSPMEVNAGLDKPEMSHDKALPEEESDSHKTDNKNGLPNDEQNSFNREPAESTKPMSDHGSDDDENKHIKEPRGNNVENTVARKPSADTSTEPDAVAKSLDDLVEDEDTIDPKPHTEPDRLSTQSSARGPTEVDVEGTVAREPSADTSTEPVQTTETDPIRHGDHEHLKMPDEEKRSRDVKEQELEPSSEKYNEPNVTPGESSHAHKD